MESTTDLHQLLHTPPNDWPANALQAATQDVTGRQTHVADMPYIERVAWLAYGRACARLQQGYDITLDEESGGVSQSFDIEIADYE